MIFAFDHHQTLGELADVINHLDRWEICGRARVDFELFSGVPDQTFQVDRQADTTASRGEDQTQVISVLFELSEFFFDALSSIGIGMHVSKHIFC